ncbi:hypothetical protein [Streptomyces misionensis]|uniref:hypothetical protein n=1 Tax=Streptomyces misionensis TaxID=67331 RepID=UPI003F4D1C74
MEGTRMMTRIVEAAEGLTAGCRCGWRAWRVIRFSWRPVEPTMGPCTPSPGS